MIHHLVKTHSIVSNWVNALRNRETHHKQGNFRLNLQRISHIMAYEVSQTLNYRPVDIATPLGIKSSRELDEALVLAPILRAGLSMHAAFLEVFEEAGSSFLLSNRQYSDENSFEIAFHGLATAPIEGKTLIILDPMIATGSSIIQAIDTFFNIGKPKKIIVCGIIASKHGLEKLKERYQDIEIWVADIDEEINDHGYIVPGLGDAGDLAFGSKL
ncbi:MAG: uracil phosphoribosyltransferase [Chitinophagales bacterium]|jgi:uracil phosphoribosyltransferase|nr:uracil phosphoribosyltransferase [Chitinophagales bacterium]